MSEDKDSLESAIIEDSMEKIKVKFPPCDKSDVADFKSTDEFIDLLSELSSINLDNQSMIFFLKEYGYKSDIIGDEVMWMIGSEII